MKALFITTALIILTLNSFSQALTNTINNKYLGQNSLECLEAVCTPMTITARGYYNNNEQVSISPQFLLEQDEIAQAYIKGYYRYGMCDFEIDPYDKIEGFTIGASVQIAWYRKLKQMNRLDYMTVNLFGQTFHMGMDIQTLCHVLSSNNIEYKYDNVAKFHFPNNPGFYMQELQSDDLIMVTVPFPDQDRYMIFKFIGQDMIEIKYYTPS